MTLTPEQSQAVTSWIAAGDNLSAVQRKLADQFKLSLTYMDVRFLVDDLNLQLKDAAPKAVSTDLKAAKGPAPAGASEKKGLLDKAKEKLGFGASEEVEEDESPDAGPEDFDAETEPDSPAGGGRVSVAVDKVTLLPGAVASGTVTFSDGVTGKWIVDNYGRPGFTEISRKDYRPSPADAQLFMQELSAALQQRGF
ncbi:MAG TPA: hypothetical protein VGL42_00310 [Opitutaceae bacterium]|jgi:hypothetical protein